MSNGSPHDPNAPGEGYGHGQGYGDGYGGGYGEYGDEGGYGGEYTDYAGEYGEYNEYGEFVPHPSQGRQQAQPQQPHPSYPQQVSYPREGWGGESDQDATAFVQLPAGPLPPPGAGAEAWDALAAPGTGQGGYTPPPLDPAEVAGQQASGQHAPPPAAADPASAGQWEMPFGQGMGAGAPGMHDPSAYGQGYEQQAPGQQPPGQHSPGQQARQPGGAPAFGGPGMEHGGHDGPGGPGGQGGQGSQGGGPGSGSAMGQGAAAALAGSHEARTRRPLGTGGGVPADEAEPIGPGRQLGGHGAAAQQAAAPHQHDTAAGAHLAAAHARRQVPFEGHEAVSEPGAGAGDMRPGDEGTNAPGAYAQPGPESEHPTPGGGAAEDVHDGGREDGQDDEPQPVMGTVRSGLPFTPSSGPATGSVATGPGTDGMPSDGPSSGGQRDADQGGGTAAGGGGWGETPAPPAAGAANPSSHAAASGPDASAPAGDVAGGDVTGGETPHGTDGRGSRAAAPRRDTDDAAGEPVTDGEVSEEPPVELAPELGGEHPHVSYVLHVNGIDRPVTDAWIGESLLYVLRERLGLAGAKDGCSQGECGACSVQVDGRLVASCLVPAATAAGSEIRTVEGLAADGVPSDVQRALTESGAVQCGFCVPGLAMTVHDLLEGNHAPSELETRKAISGNLCRCSGYRGVLDAVRTVVTERAEQAAREEAEAEAEAEAYEQELAEASARIPQQAGPGAGGAHFPDGGAV
ncbi:2Fe-2S iron-sulfur cluster-binding protein [Streptomyces winkii]|uniref:2Fe-2S iron-sulfur cluster-binding protein n=1 Tax=Streptomyces winkii TaxID=3051178 RepID=UPI0028CFF69E|nr:2Fe-2S iron-sulfur cluster-binding protein [Streptomyces sp. DSM 40971]